LGDSTRRLSSLCVLAVLLAACLIAVSASSARAEEPWWERCGELPANQIEACFNHHNHEDPPASVAINCADNVFGIEPSAIGVSCDRTFKFYGIHWRSWGGHTAVGVGRARLQGCVPFCADGRVTRPRANLRLTHLVTVEGEPVYALLHYKIVGAMPYRGAHRGTIHMLPDSS
jgi:hypothetical protein